MPLDLQTFYKRSISAAVFVVVMLTGLLWNQWAFLALVCLIQFLCIKEYVLLMQKIDQATRDPYWPRWLPVFMQVAGLALLAPVYTVIPALRAGTPLSAISSLWWLLPIVPAFLLLAGFLSKKDFPAAAVQSLAGLMYISLPMSMLLAMRIEESLLPLSLILMIWCNDTMAYLVGSFIGKHPLSPISPKKTWEGTLGGALLTVAAAALYGHFLHKYRMTDWMALALCATIAGSLGDLLESKMKRMANVKDSGSIMPGHGGALDRFDSLLIATPFAFAYVFCFMV